MLWLIPRVLESVDDEVGPRGYIRWEARTVVVRASRRAMFAKTNWKPDYAAFRFSSTSARPCIRLESAGVFAVFELFSSEGAMRFSFATFFAFMFEPSAL